MFIKVFLVPNSVRVTVHCELHQPETGPKTCLKYIDGLVYDSSNSSVLAMELTQSSEKPLI